MVESDKAGSNPVNKKSRTPDLVSKRNESLAFTRPDARLFGVIRFWRPYPRCLNYRYLCDILRCDPVTIFGFVPVRYYSVNGYMLCKYICWKDALPYEVRD